MPDAEGNSVADSGTDTPLHAYKDGRSEDVQGDPTAKDVVQEGLADRDNPDREPLEAETVDQ